MPLHSEYTDENLHQSGYVQDSDPGAVGAGKSWFTETPPIVHKIRNAADTDWDEVIDPNAADTADLGDAAFKDTGTGAGDVSAGNHNHSGTYANASHSHSAGDLPASGISAGTYKSTTIDTHGLATAGTALQGVSVSELLYQGYDDTTVASSAAEGSLLPSTGIGSLIIPANYFTAGRAVHIRAGGRYKVRNDTDSLQVKLKFTDNAGSPVTTVFGDTGAYSTGIAVAATFLTWFLEYDLVCYTTGGSGTFWGQGKLELQADQGVLYPQRYELFNPAGIGTAVVLDTAKTLELKMTATWSFSSANNNMTLTNLRMMGY